jgi:hypothetical protein
LVRTSTKYALWLNYDNDKKQYRLPVNPEKIKLKVSGKTTTSDIDKLGTLLHKGKRDAIQVSWSSFFPARYGSYCACTSKEFKKAAVMHKWILALMEAANPVHFVLTGGPFALNIYAVITSYSPEEDGGDPGTIQYSIELKEYRSVKVTKYKKTAAAKKTTTSTAKNRVTNTVKTKTYTVKQGDCLWNIAIKYYGKGKGAQYVKIYNANKTAIEKDAKKHGFSSSNNGNRIWPGLKLTIP